MKLSSEDVLKQPASIVYPLVRDEMQKILPFLLNVERIDRVSYERIDEKHVKIVNHWHPKVDIPSIAQKFIKPDYLSWEDHAVWDDEGHCVEYKIKPFVDVKFFSATGKNFFTPEGDGSTRIKVTCDVEIYPDKIPGVPSFLAKKFLPSIEDLIRKMMEPNLTSLSKGLMDYFSNQSS